MTDVALASSELRLNASHGGAPSGRVRPAMLAAAIGQGLALLLLIFQLRPLWSAGWPLRAALVPPLLSVLGVAALLLPPTRRRLIAAMEAAPSPEHGQVFVRTIFSAAVACWVLVAALIEPAAPLLLLIAAVSFMFPLSFVFLFDLLRAPALSPARRRLAMLFDGVTTSVFLALGRSVATVWWPAYLWTIFGQGMRYGLRALVEATAINLAGFVVVVGTAPYWQHRPMFSASIIVGLAAVPAYAAILVSRLHAAVTSADAANGAKSRFLAFITHELRSPLNAVIGFSEMLRDEALGPLGAPRYKEWASDINGGAKHLLALINNLLDISKLEAGGLVLAEEPIELGELIEASFRLMSPEADKRGVDLRFARCQEVEVWVSADPLRLRQVLLNLISNAVKFSSAGGEVKVEIADLARDGVLIEVSDTGVGMRPEDIPRALEPYGQVDASLKRRHQGTGLGLPLTKTLVERHGGKLEIESALGRGTTVRIRLPEVRRIDGDLPTRR
jgi:signal transduction histidine kinase